MYVDECSVKNYLDLQPSWVHLTSACGFTRDLGISCDKNENHMYWPIYVFLKKEGKSINRGSYMSAHVLLNLLIWGKQIKCQACRAFYLFFATSLINSIIQEQVC